MRINHKLTLGDPLPEWGDADFATSAARAMTAAAHARDILKRDSKTSGRQVPTVFAAH
jgi:hypothetical protein